MAGELVRWGLDGRIALVTGGSRGIGKAIARRLAEEGCDVAVNFHRSHVEADEVAAWVRERGRRGVAVQADVADPGAVETMREGVLRELGRVDILVNNAGIHQHLRSWELTAEDWDRVIDVNLTGAYLVSRAFAPDMVEAGWGRIINISSIIADLGTDHEAHYAASKAGMHGLTKSLALELSPNGVMVNAVAPGYIATDMTAGATEEELEEAMRNIPLGRLGDPSEIASVVAYLASDDASYVTGQVLHVNGGQGLY
jgi:3-oxoacyl-[acyl-carrier protein] reductase